MNEPRVRITPYYSPRSDTTTYLLYRDDQRNAALIDPTPIDSELYRLIMRNNLELSHVFVTHPEAYMRPAIRTLSRIWPVEIVCGEENVFACDNRCISGEGTLTVGSIPVTAVPALPHSRSSFFFRVGAVIFTGSIVHAGTIGETSSAYAEALLIATVKDYIFTLDRDTLILPSVGPPSTVAAERNLSPYYREE
ncbi:MAG: MBL fold metallo-hydrolase [Alkalispirochaeta sp.]